MAVCGLRPKAFYQGLQRVPCCLEVFEYSRASKKYSFVTPDTWCLKVFGGFKDS